MSSKIRAGAGAVNMIIDPKVSDHLKIANGLSPVNYPNNLSISYCITS
ncbi:MAG: hypothetical protein ABI778_10355 [Ignavibacteriota bacterium]